MWILFLIILILIVYIFYKWAGKIESKEFLVKVNTNFKNTELKNVKDVEVEIPKSSADNQYSGENRK
jgi:hypothetical protein